MQSYLICTGTSGRCVVFGEAESEPVTGQPITLLNARMVIYWPAECNGLFGLAAKGPKEDLRITNSVEKTATDNVTQWLSVSDEVAEQLKQWPTVC